MGRVKEATTLDLFITETQATQGDVSGTEVETRRQGAGLLFAADGGEAWDATALGGPTVRCYLGDNEDRWYMWYHGRRSGGTHPEELSSGNIGVATSTDGVTWKRGSGAVETVRGSGETSLGKGTDVGTVITTNEDWWTFDTCHLGVSDVQILSNSNMRASGGVYWMFYYGGDFAETEVTVGNDTAKVEGLCTRVGLALSQDGVNWARIEGDHHSGALLDIGSEGEWDSMSMAAPQVITHRPGDMRMYYHGTSSITQPTSIGICTSEDGFRWKRTGKQVLEAGAPGSFDASGLSNPNVVRLTTSEGGGYRMFYEALDEDGVRSIGAATSKDGLSWKKVDGPVFSPSEEDGAWDSKGVGSPCLVPMAEGKYRLYYAGASSADSAFTGIGLARTSGSDAFSFDRWSPKTE
ncbi:hypothetical protein CYMTET_10322 [Cymbomonas tetramitiformis]|uniref:Glycosyl hydrolase n=1 Tax=Cymbomonas tetramitiformis TaxID=36881 RepID=A0AAE0GQY4_9CHLO|nr:hypothetical protein CYMTET_10322 [Cymbomonas tetramitiformis]